MRIGVIGLGAVGGVVATRLLASAKQGETVALAAGSARIVAALREGGLAVRWRGSELRAPAPPLLAENLLEAGAPYDLILLCTRTDAMERALASVAERLAADGAVVCLQNGLPEDRAAAVVGRARTLGAVIGWSASAECPGRYDITGGGKFILGAAAPEGASKLRAAREVLERVFPVRTTGNLAGARWTKLAMNCALSTLGAISGLDLGGLAARADVRSLALRIVGEAVEVARAKGVRLERVAGLDPAWITDKGPRAALAFKHALLWLAARRRPRQRSGMLVRLLSGRPAGQVDDLNGAVVAAAHELGLAAPLNARLCDLVHRHRARRRGARQAPDREAHRDPDPHRDPDADHDRDHDPDPDPDPDRVDTLRATSRRVDTLRATSRRVDTRSLGGYFPRPFPGSLATWRVTSTRISPSWCCSSSRARSAP